MPKFDSSAPRYDATTERSSFEDVAHVMKGATEICETIQDNDSERWSVTKAGQLVRQTGEDLDRYYVFERDDQDAIDMLVGMADDEALAKVWTPEEIAEMMKAAGLEP